MQDLYGLPIDYDYSRHGYYYTEDVVFSPFLQLSESEMAGMTRTHSVNALPSA